MVLSITCAHDLGSFGVQKSKWKCNRKGDLARALKMVLHKITHKLLFYDSTIVTHQIC